MATEYKFDALEASEKQLHQLIERTYPDEFKKMVLQIAYELQGLTKENTPVDTSLLRDGWKVGQVKKRGSAYYVEISNNIEYTQFVEEGHRTRGSSTVAGVKMFEISLAQINARLPNYLKSWLQTFIQTHEF